MCNDFITGVLIARSAPCAVRVTALHALLSILGRNQWRSTVVLRTIDFCRHLDSHRDARYVGFKLKPVANLRESPVETWDYNTKSSDSILRYGSLLRLRYVTCLKCSLKRCFTVSVSCSRLSSAFVNATSNYLLFLSSAVYVTDSVVWLVVIFWNDYRSTGNVKI